MIDENDLSRQICRHAVLPQFGHRLIELEEGRLGHDDIGLIGRRQQGGEVGQVVLLPFYAVQVAVIGDARAEKFFDV